LGKNNRIQLAREIIARVKKEMQLPRLTESVRNGFSAQAVYRPSRNSLPILREREF